MSETRTLIIAFLDLTLFSVTSTKVSDDAIADTLDGWYELVGATVAPSGGRVIKTIGDGALIVWDDGKHDDAVGAVIALKQQADAWLAQRGWPCRVMAKVHVGPVRAGDFGPAGDKRFDVLGKNVNATAMMKSTGVAVSPELRGKLSAATIAQLP